MKLKSIYFLMFLISVQCRIRARHWESAVGNLLNTKTKNGSDIPPEGYIAYGRQVLVGEFPWMTSIDTKINDGSNYVNQCGGSLISDRHVLTAAHCIKTARYLTDVIITVGDYKRNGLRDCDVNNRCTVNHRTHPVRVIQNQNYDPTSQSNDIAILRLKVHVNTDKIPPISLPPFDVDDPKYENAPLTVAGWGLTEKNKSTDILLATEVNLKTRNQCYKIYNYLYPEGHLCAGKPETRTSSCSGDSGGPLMMYYKNKFYVCGVVSFHWVGETCGATKANYYTNVFKYMKWIKWAMKQ